MMSHMIVRAWGVAIVSTLLILAFAFPALAQSDRAELEATIRASLMEDPETALLPEEELSAMISALADEAEAQGVTSDDLTAPSPEPLMLGDIELGDGLSAGAKTGLTLLGLLVLALIAWFLFRWLHEPPHPVSSGRTAA